MSDEHIHRDKGHVLAEKIKPVEYMAIVSVGGAYAIAELSKNCRAGFTITLGGTLAPTSCECVMCARTSS